MTTAASVMIRPRNSPAVGVLGACGPGAGERSTSREYNGGTPCSNVSANRVGRPNGTPVLWAVSGDRPTMTFLIWGSYSILLDSPAYRAPPEQSAVRPP